MNDARTGLRRLHAPLARIGALLAFTAAACAPTTPATPARAQPPAPSASGRASVAPDPEPFRAERPKPGAPGEFNYPVPRVVRLPSGLSVYLVKRPARVVAIELNLRHGSGSDPEKKSGLAALCARMLTEGTRRKSALALSEAVESLGTTLGAAATRDSSHVGLTALPADVQAALALLSEVVTEPAFSAKEFDRVRAEWLDGLRADRQNPQRLATLLANRWLFGARHGAPVDGKLGDVEKLTVADLRAFHAKAYTPDNAALVVVGAIDEEQVLGAAQRLFAPFRGKNGVEPPLPAPESAPEATRIRVVDRKGAVQSAIAVIQPFPKRSEPGYETRQVLGRLLGGLFTSRLNTRLREEHAYTYGAFAQPWAARQLGALVVYTSVRTDVTAPALTDILGELERARDPSQGAPIREDEVQRAKADLVFSLGATLEHPSRVGDRVGASFIDGQAPDYDARYAELIGRISTAEVQRAAAVISKGNAIVVVGDREKIAESIAKLGYPVETISETLLDN